MLLHIYFLSRKSYMKTLAYLLLIFLGTARLNRLMIFRIRTFRLKRLTVFCKIGGGASLTELDL